MAKKRYTKAEEEILQILNEADHEPAWRRVRLPRPPRGRPPSRFKIDTTWLPIGLSFGLALVAILIAAWSSTLAVLLAIISVLVFLSPIVTSRRPGGLGAGMEPRRWRGRDLDLPPIRSGILGEIRYRLWQFRNRR